MVILLTYFTMYFAADAITTEQNVVKLKFKFGFAYWNAEKMIFFRERAEQQSKLM